MKIDLMDINKFIKINECPKVTNPIMFERDGYPTDEGLLSYTNFGLAGSYDRKTIYGYIDLGKKFLHPVAYHALTKVKRLYSAVIDGTGYFKITPDGDIIEDMYEGDNGIEWLYQNWEKLKFTKTSSIDRTNNIGVLSLPKNLIFIDSWLVVPAFYRDVDMSKSDSGRQSYDEINNMYAKLLNLTSSLTTTFNFMGRVTESRIQNTLNEIYEYLTGKFEGKKGTIKQALLGKTVDYSTRGVISAGRINSNKWQDQVVPFGYAAIPLSHLCNLFYPFMVYEITTFFEDLFSRTKTIRDEKGNSIKLKNPMEDYTNDKIKQMIGLYIDSEESRFMPLRVNTEEGFRKLNLYNNDLKREFTITDLLFMVATDIVQDKHVYITRYPVETYQSIYPAKIKVLTTYKTTKMNIDNRHFENYPLIYPNAPDKNSRFTDSIVISNAMLQALGGDYDGKNKQLIKFN